MAFEPINQFILAYECLKSISLCENNLEPYQDIHSIVLTIAGFP
jgi:hypothetical protein